MSAFRVDQDVPVTFVNKNRSLLMEQVPANEVKVSAGMRNLNRQSEVAATLGCAIFAKNVPVGYLVSLWLGYIFTDRCFLFGVHFRTLKADCW